MPKANRSNQIEEVKFEGFDWQKATCLHKLNFEAIKTEISESKLVKSDWQSAIKSDN